MQLTFKIEDLLEPYISVINSFEVRFWRHRIPFTLIPPLAISLLLELAVEKVNLFQMKSSVPGILFVSPMKDFLESAKYLKSGCYGVSI